ncbi:MAG: DnaJ domain-containing protein [Clostridia bacterium]|nr:DnaJ domain-containing protein [Clostridia bacterium]
MKDPYSILGLTKNATDDEVKAAYRELARKYHPDNYTDDNPLKDLAKEKMQEVNEAYDKITRDRSKKKSGRSNTSESYTTTDDVFYQKVRTLINDRNFRAAEVELSHVPATNRPAEWHYLASVLLMHRQRVNDAMRELEIACNMDPSNEEYQRAKEMFNNTANNFQGNYYNNNPYGSANDYRRQSNANDTANCCMNLLCLDCLCEMCGGDLIRCI